MREGGKESERWREEERVREGGKESERWREGERKIERGWREKDREMV